MARHIIMSIVVEDPTRRDLVGHVVCIDLVTPTHASDEKSCTIVFA